MSLYLVSVAAGNKVGSLALVTRQFAKHGVNLQGFLADDAGMKFLTKDLTATQRALMHGAFDFDATEVHEIFVEDRPGSLSAVCQKLAEGGVNIVTAFGVASGNAGRIYVQVSDPARAAAIIDAMGLGHHMRPSHLGRIAPTV